MEIPTTVKPSEYLKEEKKGDDNDAIVRVGVNGLETHFV